MKNETILFDKSGDMAMNDAPNDITMRESLMDSSKLNRIIDSIREEMREEMMTTGSTAGKPGFSSKADAKGPTAGFDPLMGPPTFAEAFKDLPQLPEIQDGLTREEREEEKEKSKARYQEHRARQRLLDAENKPEIDEWIGGLRRMEPLSRRNALCRQNDDGNDYEGEFFTFARRITATVRIYEEAVLFLEKGEGSEEDAVEVLGNTEKYVGECNNIIILWQQFVRTWLLDKPEWHARAWNLHMSVFNKAKKWSESSNLAGEHREAWKNL